MKEGEVKTTKTRIFPVLLVSAVLTGCAGVNASTIAQTTATCNPVAWALELALLDVPGDRCERSIADWRREREYRKEWEKAAAQMEEWRRDQEMEGAK